MFQVQTPMQHDNKHSLPPLSHIITAATMPYATGPLQAQSPAQAQAQQQQQQPRDDASEPRQTLTPPSSNSPVEHSVKDPPSPKYAAKQPTDRCTCKHEGNHIPRPRNAFILFRQQHHQSVLDEGNVIKTNPDVSRELGKRWRDLSPPEKEYWNKLAEDEKKRHAEKYPGYRYIPRRFGNKKGSCPFCRAKAAIKSSQQRAATQNVSYVETNYHTTHQSHSHKREPDQQQQQQSKDVRTYTPTLSEEHAIAQSFLSLRNQQPAYIQASPPQHHQHHQHPMYYQQYPAMYPPPPPPQHFAQHQHQHPQHHMHHVQQQPLPSLNNYRADPADLPRVSPAGIKTDLVTPLPSTSPTDKSKVGSIASFLN